MKEIQLTQGKVALVDDEDFEELNKHKWYAEKHRNTFYAIRNYYKNNGKKGIVCMHRVILCLTDPKMLTDHIDHNGLNNQQATYRTPRNSSGKFFYVITEKEYVEKLIMR